MQRRKLTTVMPTTTLLLIDVQKDFHPGGSLAIPTANEDAERIAAFIRSNGSKIDRIVATLDSHHKLHIAHPGFWLAEDSTTHPNPFTIITSQEIAEGKWRPNPKVKISNDLLDESEFLGMSSVLDDSGTIDATKYAIEYTKRLEEKGRFKLCVWPEHCLIGSPGFCLVDMVREAIDIWSQTTGGSVEWVLKGQNLLTEMYSALEAEVPVSKSTSFNVQLQKSLVESDKLLVCGQAMSHCVNYTLRDIVSRWPEDQTHKISLLKDCASPVPGFEEAGENLQVEMAAAGVKVQKVSEVFAVSP